MYTGTGDLILGIDVGTTGTKCTIYDFCGNIAATAYQDYPMLHPAPNWTEQDPNVWWDCVCRNLHACFKEQRVDSSRIAVISTSCTNAITLVDKNGVPLYNAIGLHDQRADAQLEWLEKNVGAKRFRQSAANRLSKGTCALTSIRWIIDERPELIADAYKFLMPSGFVIQRLTGEFTINHSRMDLTLLGNIFSGKWEDEVVKLAGVPERLLPRPCGSCDVVGTVTQRAANQTGLKAGTPVTGGAVDTMAATVGSGAVFEGDFAITVGSSGRICYVSQTPVDDVRLINSHLAFDNRYLIVQTTDNAGISLRWFRDNFGEILGVRAKDQGTSIYRQIDIEAERTGPGSDGLIYLPYLAGEKSPIWNSHARGVFFNIGLGTTFGSFARAVLEGVAFSIRDCADLVIKDPKHNTPIPLGGGIANSRLWCQIFADVLGRPILRLRSNETETLGDMIIGAQAVGIDSIPKDYGKTLAKQGEVLYPDENLGDLYQKAYQDYRSLYQALKPIYR